MAPTPTMRHRRPVALDAAPTFGPAAVGGINYTEITLTNAQIKALRASPLTLVLAPGLGRYLDPIAMDLVLKAGTNVLTEATANLDLRYVGKAAGVLHTSEMTGFIDQAVDMTTRARVANDKIITRANCENLGLELFNNGAGEFGGNAALDALLKVRLWYSSLNF